MDAKFDGMSDEEGTSWQGNSTQQKKNLTLIAFLTQHRGSFLLAWNLTVRRSFRVCMLHELWRSGMMCKMNLTSDILLPAIALTWRHHKRIMLWAENENGKFRLITCFRVWVNSRERAAPRWKKKNSKVRKLQSLCVSSSWNWKRIIHLASAPAVILLMFRHYRGRDIVLWWIIWKNITKQRFKIITTAEGNIVRERTRKFIKICLN